jgi:hypothetical protein
VSTTEGFMQFSKAPTSANFGDLPRGEIPEPLKFNRPFRKFALAKPLAACPDSVANFKEFIIITLNFRGDYPQQRNPCCH